MSFHDVVCTMFWLGPILMYPISLGMERGCGLLMAACVTMAFVVPCYFMNTDGIIISLFLTVLSPLIVNRLGMLADYLEEKMSLVVHQQKIAEQTVSQ